MKKHTKQSFVPYIFLLICVGVVLLPLCKPGLIITDDSEWMAIRLSAFYQAFADGQFPVRYLMRLNNNYGYPVANFLYPGFLYIGSVLRLVKLSYPTIIEIIVAGSVGIGASLIFLWLKKFFSGFVSFIGAATFIFSPYLLYDLYKRGSVGELMGVACAAVLLWTLESGIPVFIAPAVAIFLLSHNTLALLLACVIAVYICIRKKWEAIIPSCIGILMAAFFWIPAIFEQQFVRFDLTTISNPQHYRIISLQLLCMSIPFFIPVILLFRKKITLYKNEFIFFSVIAIGIIFAVSPLGSGLWNTVWFSRFIQFPYRILAVLFFVGPWLIAYGLTVIGKKWMTLVGILCICFFISINIPLFIQTKSVWHEEGYYSTNEGTTTVSDEYMPRWVITAPAVRPKDKVELFSGMGSIDMFENSTKITKALLNLKEDSIIQFNTIYYPGWGAVLDGKPIEIVYKNPRGVIQVHVPKGNHMIEFEFRETAFRYIADVISSIGVILFGIYIAYMLTRSVERKRI